MSTGEGNTEEPHGNPILHGIELRGKDHVRLALSPIIFHYLEGTTNISDPPFTRGENGHSLDVVHWLINLLLSSTQVMLW